ncbi:TolB family protein [Colwellia psychrerythraea]|uniref:WD40-like beta Propeller containing protein n=1 Tax=Colwellia psychrerythraea TaxID=28229 RepID=A0A099KX70_COLPS|nr:PD40 domain-containing protein [Colwellia psychrerythraea]KGJ94243.1 WD40-like beta Propeller containing protein [Colwellia psychrerythraea]
MKYIGILITLLFFILACSSKSYSQDQFPIPDGPYLGQTTPGSTPEIFAPGIVNREESTDLEGMFGSDINTFYFVREGEEYGGVVKVGAFKGDEVSYGLAVIEYKNNKWQHSVVAKAVSEPSISPDGNTILFKNGYIERTSDGWSEMKSLGEPFASIGIMRSAISSNGTIYFDTYTRKLDTPLRYSRLVDGKYETPKSLGPQFGIGKYNAHPFIAPDESYIIFDSIRESGYGRSDLYISYRAADGSWGPAINLGDKINTDASEKNPSVSPDGKFLFFDRRVKRGNADVTIYWVDAQIIETLRPK